MNKFFVRLFVACTCFALSLGLTSLSKLFRGADYVAAVEPARETVDFANGEEQLREIYREYGPAQTRHDRAFFERVETDDFILFLGEEHFSREQDIRWMENSPTDIVYESQPELINIFEDSAMVRGKMEARYSDGNVSRWSFIDVWVKNEDVWQIQSTTSCY